MRVKTAFILCAGLGKRLNPVTLETPKPLPQSLSKSVLGGSAMVGAASAVKEKV